jgi:superfamily II DNA helicase RecQ
MLKPYMLRRLKEEVIEGMPELTKQKQWVELEGEQNKIYHQMEKNMIAELSEQEEIKAPIIISKIMRLKQISVSEQLLAEKPSLKKFKKSAKIKVLNEIIDDSGDQKLVVFTQFQKSAKLLAKLLDKQKIGYGIIHGGVKTEQRQKEVNKFQNNKDCKVFIATIKTGGLGLTLTAGSIAVFLDKDWTTANNNQAVDRLHRIGQEKNVTVIELLAKDSIEEYIEKLLAEKQKTFDSLIEGKITPKEILEQLFEKDYVVKKVEVIPDKLVVGVRTISVANQFGLEQDMLDLQKDSETFSRRQAVQAFSFKLLSRTLVYWGSTKELAPEQWEEFLSSKAVVVLDKIVAEQNNLEKQVKAAINGEDINEVFSQTAGPADVSEPSSKKEESEREEA